MYLIERTIEKNFPIDDAPQPITARFTTADLPKSYLDLIQHQNGGYLQNMRIATEEPTSDGLDFALLHYVLGLHHHTPYSLFQHQVPDLPDYFIIFSVNGNQLFAFDYSALDEKGEPAIRHLDIETDNWQTVAPNFTRLLEQLEAGLVEVPLEGKMTRWEAEHSFLLAEDAERIAELFLHLEATENKVWYLEWLNRFARHPEESVRQAAVEALETQVLFFRLCLPPDVRTLIQLFLADESALIREQAAALMEELD